MAQTDQLPAILMTNSWGKKVYGGERWVIDLCKHMNRSRFNPVATMSIQGDFYHALVDLGMPVYHQKLAWVEASPKWKLLTTGLDVLKSALQLGKIIRKHNVRLIHVFDIHALEASYLAGLLNGIPLVATIPVPSRFAWTDEALLRRLKLLISLTQSHTEILQSIGVKSEKIVSLPHGIHPELFENNDGAPIRAEFGIADDELLIGEVAGIEPKKRQDLLLSAAPAVLQRYPHAKFMFIGHDKTVDDQKKSEYQQQLDAMVSELNLGQNVIFTGYRTDVPKILAALDIFVLCSNREILPTSLMEASASAKPVVATAVDGIPDIIEDNGSGFLIPPGDAPALSRALLRLLDDMTAAKRMGQRGRQIIHERFSVQQAVIRQENLYEQVIQGAKN